MTRVSLEASIGLKNDRRIIRLVDQHEGGYGMQKEHINHCLTCRTKNCYHRKLGAKTSNCLEIDYAKEIRLEATEAELMNKANSATQKAFERRTKGDFTLNWLKTFLKDFFGMRSVVNSGHHSFHAASRFS